MTPRCSATHAPGSGLISTDASPKIINFIKSGSDLKGFIGCLDFNIGRNFRVFCDIFDHFREDL